jgi:hypothetical protein
MSRPVKIVLPDPVAAQLAELAANADQAPATLAGRIVRDGVALAARDGKVRPLRSAPVLVARTDRDRPLWLEPYGGDPDWRSRMWGAIVALYGRYSRHLGALKDEWWIDESHTETLCALAVWRAEIDDSGQDPREELAFQNQLVDYAQALRQEGGGVTKAWRPGAPPEEWTSTPTASLTLSGCSSAGCDSSVFDSTPTRPAQ